MIGLYTRYVQSNCLLYLVNSKTLIDQNRFKRVVLFSRSLASKCWRNHRDGSEPSSNRERGRNWLTHNTHFNLEEDFILMNFIRTHLTECVYDTHHRLFKIGFKGNSVQWKRMHSMCVRNVQWKRMHSMCDERTVTVLQYLAERKSQTTLQIVFGINSIDESWLINNYFCCFFVETYRWRISSL